MESFNSLWKELLANPVVQSGIAPFLATFLLVILLKRLSWFSSGVAVLLGFYVCVYLVVGFDFEPLTSTRKILLLGLVAAALGLLLDIYPFERRYLPVVVFMAAGAAVLWVVWPNLRQRTGMDLALFAAGSFIYVGWVTATMESLREDSAKAASAALALALGTGLAMFLSASAMLGQLALGLAATAGAFWLFAVFDNKITAGSLMALPVGLLGALLSFAGYTYAKLPWYSLLALAAVPVAARLSTPKATPVFLQGLVSLILAGAAAAAAVIIAWKIAGSPPLHI